MLSVSVTNPLYSPQSTVEAHSGRTDANGGHRDNKNVSGLGSYHYHCGGNPAHLHPNGVCPYKSGSGSGGSGDSTGTATAKKAKIKKNKVVLSSGKTVQLKIKNASGEIKWTSSKNAVASVNSKGKVEAKKKGASKITATVNGQKLTCKVTVQAPYIKKGSVSMEAGKKVILKMYGTNQKRCPGVHPTGILPRLKVEFSRLRKLESALFLQKY